MYTEKLTEAEQKIAQLKQLNQQRQADNWQLRSQMGLLSIPNSFEHNEG